MVLPRNPWQHQEFDVDLLILQNPGPGQPVDVGTLHNCAPDKEVAVVIINNHVPGQEVGVVVFPDLGPEHEVCARNKVAIVDLSLWTFNA